MFKFTASREGWLDGQTFLRVLFHSRTALLLGMIFERKRASRLCVDGQRKNDFGHPFQDGPQLKRNGGYRERTCCCFFVVSVTAKNGSTRCIFTLVVVLT
jgi:hypothetical protein